MCDQKFDHTNEQKTRSTKSEKWRHTRTSVEITWTNEQKADLVVTSYGRNKNHDDEINKTYSADCRKRAAVDSNKHDWDWTNRIYWKKKILYKNIF